MDLRNRSLASLLAKDRILPREMFRQEQRGDMTTAAATRAHLDLVRRELAARGRR